MPTFYGSKPEKCAHCKNPNLYKSLVGSWICKNCGHPHHTKGELLIGSSISHYASNLGKTLKKVV